ncbi:hypothetical protein ACROYT_G007598 [Oculina patagonica]
MITLYRGSLYRGSVPSDRIKEHDRDIRLSRTQTSAVSEHAHNTGHHRLWNKVKFIDRDSQWYTRRGKEQIHIRLHSYNINRDSGTEIPEAWMPTNKIHNNRRTAEGTTHRNSEDQNTPITAVESQSQRSSVLYKLSCLRRQNEDFAVLSKTSNMERTEQHGQPEHLTCQEILVLEPFKFKKASIARGQTWEKMQTNYDLELPRFRATKRAVNSVAYRALLTSKNLRELQGIKQDRTA